MLDGQPKYDSYKNSGIPWIGKVPSNWLWERGKWHHQHKKVLNSDGANDNVLSLTLRGVVNNDPDNPEGLVPNDYRTYQVFDKGDLVFKLIDLENVRTSRVGLVHEVGIMSSAYIRVAPSKKASSRFLYYFYYSLYQAEVFNKLGAGVRSTLNQHDLLDLLVPVIDLDTQNRIVKFLDEKTAEIDAAVGKKRSLIDLLNEQKAILINRAVTKGLNPAAPMKDSGVDWIGEIPAHWDVKRNKNLFTEVNQRSIDGLEQHLSMSQKLGLVPSNLVEKSLESESYEGAKLVQEGDLVLNRLKAHLAVFSVAPMVGVISPDYSIFRLIHKEANPNYFERLFKTPEYLGEFNRKVKGIVVGFYRLYSDDFMSIPLIVPPNDEQSEIHSHIDRLAKDFAPLFEKVEQEISTLNEFKQTLIANAVTGKIKI